MPSGTPALTVTVVPHAKPWWRSRTLWLNAVVLALAAAEARLGLLRDVLPLDTYQLLAFALPVANAALRLVTTTSVQLLPPAPISPDAPRGAEEP